MDSTSKRSRLNSKDQDKYLKRHGISRQGSDALKQYRMERHRRGESVCHSTAFVLSTVRETSVTFTPFPYDLNYHKYPGHIFSIHMTIWRASILPKLTTASLFKMLRTCKQWYELARCELYKRSLSMLGNGGTPMALYWYLKMSKSEDNRQLFNSRILRKAEINISTPKRLSMSTKELIRKVIIKLGTINNVPIYRDLRRMQEDAKCNEFRFKYDSSKDKITEFHTILDKYRLNVIRICTSCDYPRLYWQYDNDTVMKSVVAYILPSFDNFNSQSLKGWLFLDEDINMEQSLQKLFTKSTLNDKSLQVFDIMTATPVEEFNRNWMYICWSWEIGNLFKRLVSSSPMMLFGETITEEHCKTLITHLLSPQFNQKLFRFINKVYYYIIWDYECICPRLYTYEYHESDRAAANVAMCHLIFEEHPDIASICFEYSYFKNSLLEPHDITVTTPHNIVHVRMLSRKPTLVLPEKLAY